MCTGCRATLSSPPPCVQRLHGWTVENNPLMLVGLFTFTVRPLQHLLCWCAGLCQEPWDARVVQTLTRDTEVHGFIAESCWNCVCFWGSSAYCCVLSVWVNQDIWIWENQQRFPFWTLCCCTLCSFGLCWALLQLCPTHHCFCSAFVYKREMRKGNKCIF